MKKQYTYKPTAIRFRRWSRKKYAAFISVKNAVTIGTLSANVSERFQVKNGSVHTSVLSIEQGDKDETEEEDTIAGNWLKTDIPLFLLPACLLIRMVNQPVAAANAYTLNILVPEKRKDSVQNRILPLFSFIQTQYD